MSRFYRIILLAAAMILSGCNRTAEESEAFTNGMFAGNIISSISDQKIKVIYGGTTSPGDIIEWTISEKADKSGKEFLMVNLTEGAEIIIYGDVTPLPTGFLKLTVTDSTDITRIPIGGQAYAFEVPGLVFVVHPFTISAVDNTEVTELMVAVDRGDCNFVGDMNIIQTAFEYVAETTEYGFVNIAATASTYDFTLSGNLIQMNNSINTPGSGNVNTNLICYNGRFFDRDPLSSLSGFSSSAGGFILDLGPGLGGYVGFRTGTISAAAANKTYTGLIFFQDPSGLNTNTINDSSTPAQLTCNNWNCTGNFITNLETGTLDIVSAAPIVLNGFTNGAGTGVIQTPQPSTIRTISYEVGNKTIIAFTGVDSDTWTPGGDTNQLLNGIMVSK